MDSPAHRHTRQRDSSEPVTIHYYNQDYNMAAVAASTDKGFLLPSSPLKPLRNSFSVLKDLGSPIRINDADGIKITNKRAFFLVAYLPLISLLSIQICVGFFAGLPMMTNEVARKTFKDEGFEKWDINMQYIVAALGLITPLLYLCSYKGLGEKLTQFIKLYQKTFHHFETGECCMRYLLFGFS